MEIRFLQIFLILSAIRQIFSVTIFCNINNVTFFMINFDTYECEISNNLQISQRDLEIDTILISSNETVETYNDYLEISNYENSSGVEFTTLITYNNSINFLPSNLHEHFPNLTLLAIVDSNLLEIRQKELKNFPELQGLWLPFNRIEVIEWHLFDFNPKLSQIILTKNQIKIINSDAFKMLKNLEHLDLLENFCFSQLAASKEDVVKLIEVLDEFCKFDCECEIYFIIAFAILALFSIFIFIYVVFR